MRNGRASEVAASFWVSPILVLSDFKRTLNDFAFAGIVVCIYGVTETANEVYRASADFSIHLAKDSRLASMSAKTALASGVETVGNWTARMS